jgi:hypothetical protein
MCDNLLMRTTPNNRLERMRESFELDKSILADDYRYFTTPVKPHAPIPPSKAARKSAEQNERQSQERSETPSSDRTDD